MPGIIRSCTYRYSVCASKTKLVYQIRARVGAGYGSVISGICYFLSLPKAAAKNTFETFHLQQAKKKTKEKELEPAPPSNQNTKKKMPRETHKQQVAETRNSSSKSRKNIFISSISGVFFCNMHPKAKNKKKR